MGFEYYLFAFFIAVLMCAVAVVVKVLFSNTKKQQKMLEEREAEILKTYNAVETIMEEFQDQAKATLDELKKREQEYREAIANIPVIPVVTEDTTLTAPVSEKPARPLPPEETRIKAAGEVIERAERYIAPEKAPETKPVIQAFSAPEVQIAPIPVVSPKAAQAAYASVPQKKPAQSKIAAEQQKENVKTPVFQKFFDDAAETSAASPYVIGASGNASRKEAVKEAILELSKEGKTDVEIARQLDITRNEVQLVIGLGK